MNLVAPVVSCPYYKAEYFNNRYLSGTPTFTTCESWPISKNWGSGGPGNGIGNDNFSVRWTGRAYFSTPWYRTFTLRGDDGVRFYIDNNLIINGWRDQGYTTYTASPWVWAGYRALRIEYYENGGGAAVYFGR
jgi:hypothetical protein